MSYRLELSHQAKKTLKLLDKATIKRIERRFIESGYPVDSRTPYMLCFMRLGHLPRRSFPLTGWT